MYEGPEFRHLRYFVAVAEECSFGRAAQRLHVTQPALSIQVKQLEDGLGAPLFLRTPAGVAMTNAGRTLLPLARQLLAMRRRAVEHTSRAHTGTDSPFRFGYSHWISRNIVHEAITGYRELVPGSRIEPSSHSSGVLAERVAAGIIDAALIDLPVQEPELFVQSICTQKLLVCLRKDHELARADFIPKQAVAENLKVMFDPELHPPLFERLKRKLARGGIDLEPSEFVEHPSDVQFLIKEGAGFGLVREGAVLDEELIAKPIDGVSLSVKVAFICHEQQQRPVLPLLAYRVAKHCGEHADGSQERKPPVSVGETHTGQRELFG